MKHVRSGVVGVLICVVSALLGASPSAHAASLWTIEPTATIADSSQPSLSSVSCVAASDCTAAGSYLNATSNEVTLVEHWDGTAWSIDPTPNPGEGGTLSAVSCTSASDCTAVGSYTTTTGEQLTLAEHWDGTAWSVQATPTVPGASGSALAGVSCVPSGMCLATGDYTDGSGVRYPLAERWNGPAWRLLDATLPPGPGELVHVSCSTGAACTALGLARGSGRTLIYRWNGATWSTEHLVRPTKANGAWLYGISCTGAESCVGVGHWSYYACTGPKQPCNCLEWSQDHCTWNAGSLVEAWDGTRWRVRSTLGPPGAPGHIVEGDTLEDVACSPAACTAVGFDGENGTTLAEYWGGTRWSIQATPSPGVGSALTAVSCTPTGACMALGSGMLAEYRDGAPPA